MNIKQKLQERLNTRAAYLRVFDSPDGKTVLRHLMRVGFVTKPTFVRGDSHETALNEGSRRLVLSILNMVYRDPTNIENQVTQNLTDENT